MRFKITCCKDCSERHLACHGTCPKYLKEKEVNYQESQKIYEARKDAKMKDDAHYQAVSHTKRRIGMK